MNARNRIDAFTPAQLRLSTYYVKDRTASAIILGLYAAEQKRLGVWSIEIKNSHLSNDQIEIGQSLLIVPGRIESQTWRNGFVAKTMSADAVGIEPYVGRVSPKIDGLDSAVCKNLANRIGSDFARIIANDPATLAAFRYSPEKRKIIVAACRSEAAVSKVKQSQKGVLDALLWAGESKTKARSLVHVFQNKKGRRGGDSPYRLLFEGRQTFKTADRFAFKLDPEASERDRPQAIVIAALRTLAETDGNSLATKDEIEKQTWKDFGLPVATTRLAVETLENRGVVTAIEKPMSEIAAFGRKLFGDAGAPPSFVGLTTLIEAERRIISFAKNANAIKSGSETKTKIVERTIVDAAKLLGRRGFDLDEQQAIALRRIFANPLSIVSGPPGSGKTTIAALANVAASKIYRSEKSI